MTMPQQPAATDKGNQKGIVWQTGAQASPHARPVRVLLSVALVVSALVSLFGYEEIQVRVMARQLAPMWRLVPAAVFCIALIIYAIDRVLLVRAARFPSGKAFFQVALGLALLTFHLPGGLRDYETGKIQALVRDDVVALMHHSDARVRALAAELAGRRENPAYTRDLTALLQDPSEDVRTAAQQALDRSKSVKQPANDGAAPVGAP